MGVVAFRVLVVVILAVTLIQAVAAVSPSKSYAPANVQCPAAGAGADGTRSQPLVRPGDAISKDEQQYTAAHADAAAAALRRFVEAQNLPGIDLDAIFAGPQQRGGAVNVGLAIPGGGYKALMLGAGAVQAMDAREPEKHGRLQGLLQGASHITGVSGGAWLLGSLFLNDFPTVSRLRASPRIWNFVADITQPGPPGPELLLNYASMARDMAAKSLAGYPLTLTDIYGRLLSYVLLDAGAAGSALEWSDMASLASFQAAAGPFPIITALGHDDTSGRAVNATVYEITPFELGSFSPAVHGFVRLKYLGTALDNGAPASFSSDGGGPVCVSGLDNAGFILAASSNVFNSVIYWATVNNGPLLVSLGKVASQLLDESRVDLALVSPNPFKNWEGGSTDPAVTAKDQLALVDGATNGELVSFWPLLREERHIDLILALDISVDTKYNWPAGKALGVTAARALHDPPPATRPFPAVPDQNSFVNLGLTRRPTFFGCTASASTAHTSAGPAKSPDTPPPPIVVYIANTPMSFMSNVSGETTHFSAHDVDALFQTGADLFNQPDEADWPRCVACALVQRARERQGLAAPTAECAACFAKYCWDGSVDDRDPFEAKLHHDPSYKLKRQRV